MNKFKDWLAKATEAEEQRVIAVKLKTSPEHISRLKRDENLFVTDDNELVRVKKVMKLWSVEDENK